MRRLPHNLLYCTILGLLLALASCGHSDEPEPGGPGKEKENRRTILVYMVAANSLGDLGYDEADLGEMARAAREGQTAGGRLLVYRAARETSAGAPKLIEVTPDGTLEILKEYDTGLYSVDPARMKEVIDDAMQTAPAEGYGLVLWSHANGWLGAPEGAGNRYKAFGEDRRHYMTLQSLGKVLSDYSFDFIYADCCLMGNIETAYELRRATPLFAASPTELGLEGMPYDQNLRHLFAETPEVAEAARNTYEWYAERGKHCQMSVILTSALDDLARESRRLWQNRTSYPDVSGVQTYVSDTPCHSYDMEAYYERLGADDAWRAALGRAVIYKATTAKAIGSISMDRYCGLGSGAVRSERDIDYRGYSDTQWWKTINN